MSTASSRVEPASPVLHDIDWGTYTRLLRALRRRRGLSFPQLASAGLIDFVAGVGHVGTTELVAQFRDWVRQVLLARL